MQVEKRAVRPTAPITRPAIASAPDILQPQTASTNYSMTSSSLAQTEGLTLLDARFDKIEEDYAEDGINMDDGIASVLTEASLASSQLFLKAILWIFVSWAGFDESETIFVEAQCLKSG